MYAGYENAALNYLRQLSPDASPPDWVDPRVAARKWSVVIVADVGAGTFIRTRLPAPFSTQRDVSAGKATEAIELAATNQLPDIWS